MQMSFISPLSSNRTKVELKHASVFLAVAAASSSNRTKVELKQCNGIGV